MDKKSIDIRIEKLGENILKEQNNISQSKEKIKSFQAEIKSLEQQKEQLYADEFKKIMSENGFNSDSDKEEFLKMIKEQFSQKNSQPKPLEE